jgi:hypothetical protein
MNHASKPKGSKCTRRCSQRSLIIAHGDICSMYEINGSKQNVIDAACIRFSDIENVESIANECGMRGQMLRNKLNPVSDLIKITLVRINMKKIAQ